MPILFVLLTALVTLVSAAPASPHGGARTMNGIEFDKHKNFLREWTLVTIRFRKDTGEMRLTYANELALKAMQDGKFNYPDGAIFAKTGVLTAEDPRFTSSVVPRAVRRYQLMVKDKQKYKETDGWGYALFDAEGLTYPEEPVAAQQACHACHQIVTDRGHVFSEPFNFTAQSKLIQGSVDAGPVLKFTDQQVRALPKQAREVLTGGPKSVRRLVNDKLETFAFQGTLDEVKPMLESEALRGKRPAIFITKKGDRFVVARPMKNPDCLSETGVEVIMTTLEGKLFSQKVCLHD